MQAEQSLVVDPKSPGGINSPHGLILFDGVCVLCSRGCRFVSKRDRRGYFRFSQSSWPRDVRSLSSSASILIARLPLHLWEGARLCKIRSCVAHCARASALAVDMGLSLHPTVVRDAIYDVVARNRYRWFGRRDACILPNSDRSWPS